MHGKSIFMNIVRYSPNKYSRLINGINRSNKQIEGSCLSQSFSSVPQISVRVVIDLTKKLNPAVRYLSNQKVDVNQDCNKANVVGTVGNSGDEGNDPVCYNDTTELFDSIDYQSITEGDPEMLKKFKLLLLEVDVLRQDGERIPKRISTEKWKELFSMTTQTQRKKYLNFLWLKEIKNLSDKRKKEKKRLEYEEKSQQFDEEQKNNNHIKYGFKGNTIFLRVYDTTINMFDNSRLVQAMQFSQTVVIDCGFSKDMSMFENKLTAKQLCILFAENRLHRDPLDLQFCSLSKDEFLYTQLVKHIPTIEDPAFPINTSEESYLELYPREKLVYLTPHCRTELREYSHDDIYIIGALVDKQNNQPLTLAKAKSEGIRMAHLPIDRYLKWHIGTKSLTLNQVLSILLDMRLTEDWNLALRHVPKRKLCDPSKPFEDPRRVKRRGTTLQPPKFWKAL